MQISESGRLRDLGLKESYDSGEVGTELVRDFFEPCLKYSSSYLRIAGYFNSGMLAATARGMADFIRGSGVMKLICSPHLSAYDIQRLESVDTEKDTRSKIFDEALARSANQVSELEDLIERNHIEAMAWMIARDRLEIRIAIPKEIHQIDQLFHQKRGVLEDSSGDRLSFSGSINETHAGWSRNVEEFKVFRSWLPGQSGFVGSDRQAFLNYWEGASSHSHNTISLPDAFRQSLIKQAPRDVSLIDLSFTRQASKLVDDVDASGLRPLRDYQTAALVAWKKAGQKGILQMATGAGKTLTAAHCINEFFRANEGRGLVVVTAPYQHIASQWLSELSHYKPIAPWKERSWKESLGRLVREIRAGLRRQAVIVTVQNTAATYEFLEQVEMASQIVSTLLVGDEAHSLGAKSMSKSLSSFYHSRLGLTATPTRYFDEDGSNYLLDFFGGTVYEFSLEDALLTLDEQGRSILCPYEYRPIFFNLLPSELERYRALSLDIIRLSSKKDSDSKEKLRLKLLARARVVKSSEGKLPELSKVLKELETRHRLVIYCENLTQMEAAASVLSVYGVKYSRFSGSESVKPDPRLGGKSERESILESFREGKVDALVAMKCLDEGVNIPTAEIAILLASSGNEKEFIQRRGRMMRQSPETGKTKAIIFDFVATPQMRSAGESVASDELRIMSKELARVSEFSRSSLNDSSVEFQLFELRSKLGIPNTAGDYGAQEVER